MCATAWQTDKELKAGFCRAGNGARSQLSSHTARHNWFVVLVGKPPTVCVFIIHGIPCCSFLQHLNSTDGGMQSGIYRPKKKKAEEEAKNA